METKYTERLARLIFISLILLLIFFVCKTFSSVLVYIALAVVVSLIARPIVNLLRKIRIKHTSAPEWLLAMVSLVCIFLIISGLVAGLVPVVSNVIHNISSISSEASLAGISSQLKTFNEFLVDAFELEPDFRIEAIILEQLKSILNVNIFGNVLGSVASVVASIGIGVFSIIFIAFFLIKDSQQFTRMVCAITPDKYDEKVTVAIKDAEHLLSRYFVGLIVEMACVGIIDFIGLWAIARLDFETALGIGFLAGLMNIIPYVGPLLGGAVGTVMGMTLKFCHAGAIGLDVSFWVFFLILIAVFCSAQLVDNFLLQPIIYSTSVKASPLEIFIVLLMAGTLNGIAGMLVAIPAYTVIRVIAWSFFQDVKIIQDLFGKRD